VRGAEKRSPFADNIHFHFIVESQDCHPVQTRDKLREMNEIRHYEAKSFSSFVDVKIRLATALKIFETSGSVKLMNNDWSLDI
jgi:uncharacterized secreted protein with C-terminal beta-propeller domain